MKLMGRNLGEAEFTLRIDLMITCVIRVITDRYKAILIARFNMR